MVERVLFWKNFPEDLYCTPLPWHLNWAGPPRKAGESVRVAVLLPGPVLFRFLRLAGACVTSLCSPVLGRINFSLTDVKMEIEKEVKKVSPPSTFYFPLTARGTPWKGVLNTAQVATELTLFQVDFSVCFLASVHTNQIKTFKQLVNNHSLISASVLFGLKLNPHISVETTLVSGEVHMFLFKRTQPELCLKCCQHVILGSNKLVTFDSIIVPRTPPVCVTLVL